MDSKANPGIDLTKKFTVFYFFSDNSIEVVPSKWISTEQKTCPFPRDSESVPGFINIQRNFESVPDPSWPVWPGQCKSSHGQLYFFYILLHFFVTNKLINILNLYICINECTDQFFFHIYCLDTFKKAHKKAGQFLNNSEPENSEHEPTRNSSRRGDKLIPSPPEGSLNQRKFNNDLFKIFFIN